MKTTDHVVSNYHAVCHLERAEGEVDKVPSVATAALHAFIYQHGEHHFMNPQQGNQNQRGPG